MIDLRGVDIKISYPMLIQMGHPCEDEVEIPRKSMTGLCNLYNYIT